MAKKKPQALKFHPQLDDDLRMLADMKDLNYNAYIESVLSKHVMAQRMIIIECAKRIDQKKSEVI